MMVRIRSGRTFAVLAAAALVLLAPVAAPAQQRRMAPAQAAGTLQMPDGIGTVRVPFQAVAEHVLIPVSVNGSEPLQLVLDTGMPIGGVALYDGERVEALGLEYAPMRAQVGGAGGGQPLEARIATGVSLRIGEAVITESRALVLPRIPHFPPMHDGIIGVEVFRRFAVTVDHDRGVVELTLPDRFGPPAGADEVPLDLSRGFPFMEAGLVIGDDRVVPVRLVVDLGASHPVSLNRTSSEFIELPTGALRTRIGRGIMGPVTGGVGRIPGLVIGGRRLEAVIATFPDSAFENPHGMDSRNGNLGSGLLRHFNVTFDYEGSRMYLVPNRRFGEAFEWDMSGLVLDPEDGGRLLVAQVGTGSPADAAGIAAGDTLAAVDGRPVSGRDLPRLRELFRREGVRVELGLRRGQAARNATLRLRRAV